MQVQKMPRIPQSTMQIDEYTDRFFQMEMEEALFSIRTPDFDPAWDVVRYDVFISLFNEISEARSTDRSLYCTTPLTHIPDFASWPKKLEKTLRQWSHFNRIEKVDFLALVLSRYRDVDGREVDFASSDAVEALVKLGSVRRIESQFDLFLDLNINTLNGVASRLYSLPNALRTFLKEFSALITDAQFKYFSNSDPDLARILRQTFATHTVQRRLWAKILDRSTPRLVLMTQNGIQKGLLVEARKRRVPVLECQHGVINLMHPAYSYPPGLIAGDTVVVPDALLLFSNYWRKQCFLPGTQLLVVGNSCFSTGGVRSSRDGPAIFVSAGVFQKYLSPVAVAVARSMPNRRFIMKLHPSQTSERAALETAYAEIPNLSVVCMEKTLPALLSDASDIVIVQSTAAYEALDRGVPVHILSDGGYMSQKDLFSHSFVRVFSTSAQLRDQLFIPGDPPENKIRFFESFDEETFRSAVNNFCEQKRAH